MHADGRFGGHIVAGHVDGVGTVTAVRRDDNAVWFSIQASPTVLRYMVKKGSVTVDGVSLTIARLERGGFSVSVIPHTAEQTVLSLRRPGDPVNLEADIIAKYVDALLRPAPDSVGHGSGITREFLSQYGF